MKNARTPSIDNLISNGAYSFNAQAGTYTLSAPGWSNILCGVSEDKHGVTDNTFNGSNYDKYPSLFTRAEEYDPLIKTASVVSWDELNDNVIKDADYLISHHWDKKGEKNVLRDSLLMLERDIDLAFVYFMQPDNAGHTYGFDSNEHIAAIEGVDSQIGKIMSIIKFRSLYYQEDWLTILTSDHGGKGKHHAGIEEARTIPFIVSGSSVINQCLAELPRQVDVFPTVFAHLGIPIKKEWGLEGKVVGLK